MRHLCKWIFPVIVFFITWFACKPVFRVLGYHEWANAYTELSRLHDGILSCESEHGRLADLTKTNQWIASLWSDDETHLDNFEDSFEEDLSMYVDSVNYSRLRLWDQPPRYVISKDLPDGFGIYLLGEDNASRTGGNDPDDINSWNRHSIDYYYDRLHRSWTIRDIVISSIVAAIAFWAFRVKWIA